MKSVKVAVNLDKLGACASALCAVHCALTGVALGLLSAAGLGFLDNPITDAIFLLIAFTIGATAAWHGIKRHHQLAPSIVFCLSLLAVTIGHFAFRHQTLGSTLFSVLGGTGLVVFHLLNRAGRRDGHCSCGCETHK